MRKQGKIKIEANTMSDDIEEEVKLKKVKLKELVQKCEAQSIGIFRQKDEKQQ